jgi:hypothetical protein
MEHQFILLNNDLIASESHLYIYENTTNAIKAIKKRDI